jgi:hypothetical protein
MIDGHAGAGNQARQVFVPVTGDVRRDLRNLPWAGARGGKRAA